MSDEKEHEKINRIMIRDAEMSLNPPGTRHNPIAACVWVSGGIDTSPFATPKGPVCRETGDPIKRIYNRRTKNYEYRCENDH